MPESFFSVLESESESNRFKGLKRISEAESDFFPV